MQGYEALSDADRRHLWLGLRFAPALCLAAIATGTALGSPVLLLAMAGPAFLGGFVLPKHPFDYLYDVGIRPILGGPLVPASPAPRRFACQMATAWIVAIAVAFLAGVDALAWSLAIPLVAAGALVTATNWCLPSFVYGLIRRPTSRATA